MPTYYRPKNLFDGNHLLDKAREGGYAIGAFSPRFTPVIRPIFWAAQKTESPIMIQIAQVELEWARITLAEFAQSVWTMLNEYNPGIPVGLHLDHCYDFELIKEAISQGFTSVMIDASAKPFRDNIAMTKKVVDYAHARGVSVEAELGKIGSAGEADGESQTDEEMFTDPDEARIFVEQTNIDALAVSVGTAHGVYTIRKPRVDIGRLEEIRKKTSVNLVLHGGSGTPKKMIRPAIQLPGGGISKINIATDLELALLKQLSFEKRPTNSELLALPSEELNKALLSVQEIVEDKIVNFLGSRGHSKDFYIL